MLNEFEPHNFTLPALSDKAHMHLDGHVADLIATLAWAVKHDIPFIDALAEYVPKNKKWGPQFSYVQMGGMKTEKKEVNSILNIQIGPKMPWERFMDKLKDGQPLSAALSEFKRALPKYIVMAIKEAEARNNLKTTLPLLAERLHDTENFSNNCKVIIIYPLVQLITMTGVICGLMIFIVPNFVKIFDDLLQGEPLPEITQMVIGVSRFLQDHLGLILLIIVALFLFSKTVLRNIFVDILFVLPFIGSKIRLFVLYDIAKSMSCFMTVGDDIVQAAESTMHCQKSILAKLAMKNFIKDVRSGYKWIDAWERHLNFGAPIHLWMVRNAASREKVAEGFVHLQNWLGEELHFFSSKFQAACEFFLTLGNAIIVGSIAVALFLPIVKIIWVLG